MNFSTYFFYAKYTSKKFRHSCPLLFFSVILSAHLNDFSVLFQDNVRYRTASAVKPVAHRAPSVPAVTSLHLLPVYHAVKDASVSLPDHYATELPDPEYA